MDNRKLSPGELEVLRKKAVEAVIMHGLKQNKVCQIFGFSPSSMCKYIKEYQEKREGSFKYRKRGIKEGMRSKIQDSATDQLIRDILSKTPDELGMNYTLWNSKVIKEYIETKYAVKYSRRGVRKKMSRLGLSAQKPIKLAYQRDLKKIETWLKDTYPSIKARAIKEGARYNGP